MLSDNDLELLSAYLDGALTQDERAALDVRLQAEPELRRELARLRATVDLVGTLPTLSPPRDLILTPRMVRRPTILTSAAFSALSAAAAIILLVISVALFTTPERQPLENAVLNQVVALPTGTPLPSQAPRDEESAQSELGESANAPTTGLDFYTAQTELPNDQLNFAPLGTQPPAEIQPYAAVIPPTRTESLAGMLADAAIAQENATEQQRSLQQAAPSAASGAAAAEAPEAPLPFAPTFLPAITPSSTSSPKPTQTATPAPTTTPLPSPAPTSAPTQKVSVEPDTNAVGIVLVGVAVILLAVAVVTTLARRRS